MPTRRRLALVPRAALIAAIASIVAADSAAATPAAVLHVDAATPAPPGERDGATWATAYDQLGAALADAAASPESDLIRVAAGIYRPGVPGSGDRTATFLIPNRTIVEGGYAGAGGEVPGFRDVDAFESILSGELAVGFGGTTNVHHVVTIELGFEVPQDLRLDGLTITGGRADGACDGPDAFDCRSVGGGLVARGYIPAPEPIVRGCTFRDNEALSLGGAMLLAGGAKPVVDCRFEANHAGQAGGAIAFWDTVEPVVQNCRFTANTVESVSANHGGGAIYSPALGTRVANCLFEANHAAHGAAIWLRTPLPGFKTQIVNCTIVGQTGGPAVSERFESMAEWTDVVNTIFWENAGDLSSLQMRLVHCARPGGWPGPGFGTLDLVDPGFVAAAAGDFTLDPASPCLDAGDGDAGSSVVPRDLWDLDGDGEGGPGTTQPLPDLGLRRRITSGHADCRIDIGAFEAAAPCLADLDGDTAVGFADVLATVAFWGPCDPCNADADGDGDVDLDDLLKVLIDWGDCGCPAGSAGDPA